MLKASFEVLRPATGHSFIVSTYNESGFKAPFHFHPEYELTLITAGSGKRYIGSHMAGFAPGDLVLLGPNLPHCWKLEPADAPAASIVIRMVSSTTWPRGSTASPCRSNQCCQSRLTVPR